jgi:hypothetical protein
MVRKGTQPPLFVVDLVEKHCLAYYAPLSRCGVSLASTIGACTLDVDIPLIFANTS